MLDLGTYMRGLPRSLGSHIHFRRGILLLSFSNRRLHPTGTTTHITATVWVPVLGLALSRELLSLAEGKGTVVLSNPFRETWSFEASCDTRN